MMQIVKQTTKEKLKMYMKCSKLELAKMLIECNRILEAQMQVNIVSKGDSASSSVTLKKEGYYTDNFNTYYMEENGKKHYC